MEDFCITNTQVSSYLWAFMLHEALLAFIFLFIFFKRFKKNLMWTIFKASIEFVTILLHFMFWFFGPEACGILAPRPGFKPTPPALEGQVLTTGQAGKSPSWPLKTY